MSSSIFSRSVSEDSGQLTEISVVLFNSDKMPLSSSLMLDVVESNLGMSLLFSCGAELSDDGLSSTLSPSSSLLLKLSSSRFLL